MSRQTNNGHRQIVSVYPSRKLPKSKPTSLPEPVADVEPVEPMPKEEVKDCSEYFNGFLSITGFPKPPKPSEWQRQVNQRIEESKKRKQFGDISNAKIIRRPVCGQIEVTLPPPTRGVKDPKPIVTKKIGEDIVEEAEMELIINDSLAMN